MREMTTKWQWFSPLIDELMIQTGKKYFQLQQIFFLCENLTLFYTVFLVLACFFGLFFISVQCLFPPILRGSILTLPRPCRPCETRLHTEDVGLPPPARERGPHLEKPPRGLGLVDSNPQILNPAMPPSSAK